MLVAYIYCMCVHINMHCHVPVMVSPAFVIMKFVIWQLIFSPQFVVMCLEPDLQPIEGEVLSGSSSNTQDRARLDIGFWGRRYGCTFFDVRVFNPHAPSNRCPNCYRKHELEKTLQYEQRVIEIECASFTPLVLSAMGGTANQASLFYKMLASC